VLSYANLLLTVASYLTAVVREHQDKQKHLEKERDNNKAKIKHLGGWYST